MNFEEDDGMDKVSIIVPVYNVEEYIEECLESIIKQTYSNFELIVIDDGSTDKSFEICKKISEKDDRVSLYRQSNKGQAVARNQGLDKSKGNYIMFVDSDDYIESNFISESISYLIKNKADLVVFDTYYLVGSSRKYVKTGISMNSATPMSVNKLFKRELWEEYRYPTGTWYEDLGIIPALVALSKKTVKLNKALYNYRSDRVGSQTHSYNVKKITDTIPMLENVKFILKKEGLFQSKEKEFNQLVLNHLLNNTVLLKFINVTNKNDRIFILNSVKEYLDSNYQNWLEEYSMLDSSFKHKIKIYALKNYYKNNFLVGDILWRIPIKLMKN